MMRAPGRRTPSLKSGPKPRKKGSGPTKYKANHGHHPDKGPDPFFLGFGPDFKEGVRLPGARIIDEAPTYAKILGLTIPEADGKSIDGMLR